jgi:hypothetical protein
MPHPRVAPALEGLELGGCRLIRRLGRGSMGEVYLGEQVRLGDRLVAVKVVRPDDSALQSLSENAARSVRRRFLREGRLLAHFNHPNILPVHDAGVGDGYLYLVMQYVPDGSLADAIRGRAARRLRLPAPLPLVVDLMGQVASALQYIHDHGVVHRDVKPANVLVQTAASGGVHLLLADFGVARDVEATIDGNQIIGTVAYMAPEQYSGVATPASDQYALAVMTYLLLAGRTPFQGDIATQTRGHLYDAPPPLRALNPAIPPAAASAVARALAKRPADRFPSAMAFAAALREAQHPEGVTTAKVPPGAVLGSADTRTAETVERPDRVAAQVRPAGDAQVTRPQVFQAGAPVIFTETTEARSPRNDRAARDGAAAGVAAVPAERKEERRRLAIFSICAALLAIAIVAGIETRSQGTSHGQNRLPIVIASPRGGDATTPAPTATATVRAPTSTPTLIESAASGDSAQLISLSLPSAVAPGQHFSGTLVLSNDGTTSWSQAGGYVLTCDTVRHPAASCPKDFALDLGGWTIDPGQEAVFTLTMTAPTQLGVFTLWGNMARGGTLFPSPDLVAQLSVQAPTPAPTPTATPLPSPTATPIPSPTPTPIPSPTATLTPPPAGGGDGSPAQVLPTGPAGGPRSKTHHH